MFSSARHGIQRAPRSGRAIFFRRGGSIGQDETCTGNFRSVVNLLAKYDAPLSNHIRAVRNSKLKRRRNPIGKTKEKKSRSGRGNLVSFMSADSQNKIINSIGKHYRQFPCRSTINYYPLLK